MGSDPRPLRADAARNRRRILDAARHVFGDHGLGCGIDAVAREAGVGVGTIYRRFPTKEHLLQAIVDDRIEHLREGLAAIDPGAGPWEAFAAAAELVAEKIACDRGFFQALQEARGVLAVPDCAREATIEALEPILQRAQLAGAVRGDVRALDVLVLCGIAARLPRWRLEEDPGVWRRYLAIVLDGLRPEGAHPLPAYSGEITTSAARPGSQRPIRAR